MGVRYRERCSLAHLFSPRLLFGLVDIALFSAPTLTPIHSLLLSSSFLAR